MGYSWAKFSSMVMEKEMTQSVTVPVSHGLFLGPRSWCTKIKGKLDGNCLVKHQLIHKFSSEIVSQEIIFIVLGQKYIYWF